MAAIYRHERKKIVLSQIEMCCFVLSILDGALELRKSLKEETCSLEDAK